MKPRLTTRREAMIQAAAAAFAAGLSTPGVMFAANQLGLVATPGLTEGPYWVDGMPERVDLRSNSGGETIDGFSLRLDINVAQLSGGYVLPVSGAKVDIWEASPIGRYSAVASEGTTGQDFLRGYQMTDAAGNVTFETILPGWYTGRTPHIHFRVRLYSGTAVTYDFVSQFFLAEELIDTVYSQAPYSQSNGGVVNSTDGIYLGGSQGNGGAVEEEAGGYMLLRLVKNSRRALGAFSVIL